VRLNPVQSPASSTKKKHASTPPKSKSAIQRTKGAATVPINPVAVGKGSSSIRTGTQDPSEPPGLYPGTPTLPPAAPFDFSEVSTSLELSQPVSSEEPIEIHYPHAKLLEQVRLAMSAESAKDKASIIVIGTPYLL